MREETSRPGGARTARPRRAYGGHNPALERIMPEGGPFVVLDVGCGEGGTARWLSGHGHTVDGITWSADEARVARAFCRRVHHWDLNEGLPPSGDGEYDLIVCSHVLEHIAYPDALLDDVRRVLKPAGRLLIAIPNLFFWADRWKLVIGVWRYADCGTFDYTHLRWYTRRTMTELLDAHGLALDRFEAEGWVPLPGIGWIVGRALRGTVNRAACRWRPGLFGQQLLFRARKCERAAGAAA